MVYFNKILCFILFQSSFHCFGLTSEEQLAYARKKFEEKGFAYQPKELNKPTALHGFAALGDIKQVEDLLRDESIDIDAVWVDHGKSKTALMIASMAGHYECAELLLDLGASLSVKEQPLVKVTTSETMRAIGQCGNEDLLTNALSKLSCIKCQKKKKYLAQAFLGAYEKKHFTMASSLQKSIGKFRNREKKELDRLVFLHLQSGELK